MQWSNIQTLLDKAGQETLWTVFFFMRDRLAPVAPAPAAVLSSEELANQLIEQEEHEVRVRGCRGVAFIAR